MSSTINRDLFAPQTAGENKISQLKEDVERLQRSLEALNENEIKHDAERRIEGKLNDLEKSLHDSHAAHQQQQADVDALLNRILEKEVMTSLEHLVAAGVLEHIDDLVKKEVAELLPTHLDANVHKKIKEHREELERLEHELNNAESMRANSALRADQGDMRVHPLYNSEGRISEHFPKTLNDLIFMPGVTAARLRQEYEPGVKVSDSSRENNINAVLRLFGIGMQLVWRRSSSS
ncbi:hypothetical protein BD413DRAFT_192101 [Trametes elegans]|nr:hypothetical protein BD413DRAFT_192101 [Trametes elegans]